MDPERPVLNAQSSHNRRQHERTVVRGVAIVNGRVRADTVDISSHGVCLTLQQALEVGSSHRLDLEISADSVRRTSVVGRVCFCMPDQQGYRVGLNCELSRFLAPATPEG